MSPEIIVALITAGFATVGGIGIALINKHNSVAGDIKQTKEQVVNSHTTNLRDDLDDLHHSVRLTLTSVEGLREELRTERRERIAVAETLRQHLADCA